MEFKSLNPSTTVARIGDFEKDFGISFPSCYRNFLLDHNGGRPMNSIFPIKNFMDSFGGIQVFFGLDTPVTTSDLTWQVKNRIVRFPKVLLEIACTGTGDLVCIDTNTELAPVYFFNSRPSWRNGIWRDQDLYLIAPSFSEFLSLLCCSSFAS